MAVIASSSIRNAVNGVAPSFVSASGGGDVINNPRGNKWLVVRNGGGSPTNVTLVVPGNLWNATAAPDTVISVAAGATTFIELDQRYTDSNQQVAVSYSVTTSVTVAAVEM